jgi:hypothetical protein
MPDQSDGMTKYSTDITAEARAAVTELQARHDTLDKTASPRQARQAKEMLDAAKTRLAELEE